MIDLIHPAHRARYLELRFSNEVRAVSGRLGIAIQRAAELNGRAQFSLAWDVNGMHAFAPSPKGVTIQRMAALDPAADYCLTASNEQAKVISGPNTLYLVQTERDAPEATTLGWRFPRRRAHFRWLEDVDPEALPPLGQRFGCGLVIIEDMEEDSRIGVCFYSVRRHYLLAQERRGLADGLVALELAPKQEMV